MRLTGKTVLALAALIAAVLVGATTGSAAVTTSYPDVALSGGFQAGHFADVWDLTQGDITISATYDATGMQDQAGAHAWSQLGVRSLGTFGSPPDFNPSWSYTSWSGSTDLVSGRKLSPIGTVTAAQVGTDLYVTYAVTAPGCTLTETHIAVASDSADFPQKNGNALPGQFAYSQSQPAGTTEFTSPAIDLSAFDAASSLYVAAHARVSCSGTSESAWAQGDGFPGSDWSMYFALTPATEQGSGVWLATDYGSLAPNDAALNPNDKLILQKQGGEDEGSYDLPSTPTQPGSNYGFWFDRDGVDQWQATYWGSIDGGTYNTGGIYHVVITLHADSATTGTAYMTVNGVPQGFYDGPWSNSQPSLYPAGLSWTGDMAHQQVFYGLYGYGATHTATFTDITVTQ